MSAYRSARTPEQLAIQKCNWQPPNSNPAISLTELAKLYRQIVPDDQIAEFEASLELPKPDETGNWRQDPQWLKVRRKQTHLNATRATQYELQQKDQLTKGLLVLASASVLFIIAMATPTPVEGIKVVYPIADVWLYLWSIHLLIRARSSAQLAQVYRMLVAMLKGK